MIQSNALRSLFGGTSEAPRRGEDPAYRVAPASERPSINPLFPHLGTINVFAPGDRLSVTHGTRGPRADEPQFKDGARIPLDDWWRLPASDLRMLQSQARSPGKLNYAALVQLPDDLKRMALELGRQLVQSGRGAGPRDGGDIEKQLVEALGQTFAPGRPAKLLGSLVQPGGLRTATLDPNDDKRQGLHVDSWSRNGLLERTTAPNRICLNLGSAPRRLLMLDLGFDQIAGMMSGAPIDNPTDIARAFLALHPTYPILAVEVQPGEAYIAATENLVHDGSTIGSSAPDVTLTLLGEFRRSDAERHFIQVEATAAR